MCAEEGLVLAHRLALVVEDGPAAAHPARVDWPPAAIESAPARPGSSSGSRGQSRRSRLKLSWIPSPRRRPVADVGLARQRGSEGRLPLVGSSDPLAASLEAIQVVDDARRGLPSRMAAGPQGVAHDRGIDRLRSRSARSRRGGRPGSRRLAHDGRAHDQAQGVEGDLRSGCRWGR